MFISFSYMLFLSLYSNCIDCIEIVFFLNNWFSSILNDFLKYKMTLHNIMKRKKGNPETLPKEICKGFHQYDNEDPAVILWQYYPLYQHLSRLLLINNSPDLKQLNRNYERVGPDCKGIGPDCRLQGRAADPEFFYTTPCRPGFIYKTKPTTYP